MLKFPVTTDISYYFAQSWKHLQSKKTSFTPNSISVVTNSELRNVRCMMFYYLNFSKNGWHIKILFIILFLPLVNKIKEDNSYYNERFDLKTSSKMVTKLLMMCFFSLPLTYPWLSFHFILLCILTYCSSKCTLFLK